MTANLDFQVIPAASQPDEAILGCLNEAFGRDRSLDWFRWKHRHGPWGPSTGWAALDDEGILGIRLATPWAVNDVDGRPREVTRMTDGAVAHRGRRRGIFTRLVTTETDERRRRDGWDCLVSTAVPASRAAYEKLGWSLPEIIPVNATLVLPRAVRAALDEVPVKAMAEAPPPSDGLATSWDASSLSWRFNPLSGHRYRAVRLRESDRATTMVYRVTTSRRIRTLVEVFSRGPVAERDRLLAVTAWRSRCRLTLRHAGPGTDRPAPPRLARRGSGPALAIWTTSAADHAAHLDAWRFSGADLEGVV